MLIMIYLRILLDNMRMRNKNIDKFISQLKIYEKVDTDLFIVRKFNLVDFSRRYFEYFVQQNKQRETKLDRN